jgi:hypothetical protein
MHRFISLIGVVCLVAGCGGGGNPTGPSNSIPNVVGTYNGSVTVAFPEVPVSIVCPANTTVTQSGTTVSIAPIILRGECNNLSIPIGQITIDNTGAFTGGGGFTFTDTCPGTTITGTYTGSASGGFFGRELRISMNATSTRCLNFNFTATLTR